MMRRLLLVLLLSQLCACAWLGLTDDDPRKPSVLTPLTPTVEVKQLWTASIGNGKRAFFTPAVLDGDVFVAAGDGTVERLNAATGAEVWKSRIDPLSAGVGAGDGAIAVVDVAGELIVLEPGGHERWRAPSNGEVVSAPVIGNHQVVVRTTDGRFIAFELESGKRSWVYTRPAQPLVLRTAPGMTIANNTVYAGLPGGKLIALRQINGAPQWEAVAANPKGATELERVTDVMGRPELGPRDVCVATFQGRVGCFGLENGAQIWSRDTSTATGVGIDTRNAYVADERSVVQAYSRVAGASLWKDDKLEWHNLTAPVSMGNTIESGDVLGLVHWLSKDDGAMVARMTTDGTPIRVPGVIVPTASTPTVIVQTEAGGVYAFALP